jgi:hypothetical protein
MSRQLDKVIRHMVAWAGGDPRQVRIPRVRHRLRIRTQRVGEVRLITVSPPRGNDRSSAEWTGGQLGEAAKAVVLRGLVVRIPATEGFWLAMEGAGVIPLTNTVTEGSEALRDLIHQWVIIRGTCSAQGIAVEAVQATTEE